MTSLKVAKINVTVATLNNTGTIERCLQEIWSNIPVRRLIVVDGGSRDDTISVARRYGAKVVHEPGVLGKVRYVQAHECETRWVAYIDSDIYVYKEWWEEMSKYLDDPHVGMVLGFADAELGRIPQYDVFLKYRAKKFGAEAFSNTMVKRELVLGCEGELENVHAGEDSVVAKHAIARGYRIVTIPKRLCFHDRKLIETHPHAYFRSGQSIRHRNGARGVYRIANSMRTAARDWWAFSRDTGEFSLQLPVYLGKLYSWMIIGYLSDPSLLKSKQPSHS